MDTQSQCGKPDMYLPNHILFVDSKLCQQSTPTVMGLIVMLMLLFHVTMAINNCKL